MSWEYLEKIRDGFAVDADTRNQRVVTCNSCEHLTTMKTCSKCNCFMPAKTWFKFASCPIGKWQATGQFRESKEGTEQ